MTNASMTTTAPMAEASNRRLQGKIAFVTAAAQGIGRAITERFAAEGASVVAVDLNAEKLRAVTLPGGRTQSVDITDTKRLSESMASAGHIDVLVNCVGWVHAGTILDCSPDDWRRSFQLNVDTIYQTARFALPGMIREKKGSIINIASLAGLKSAANRAAYSATKAAVIGMTRSISADFASQGVRCNAICPAMVMTPSLGERIQAMPNPDEAYKTFVSKHPVGRLGTPEEVAALAVYLASDDSGFMTGSALVLDGGAS